MPDATLIEGVEIRDDGSAVLKLRVAAVPDKGKANAAVIALLAKALGVPKSSISLIAGDTARLKTVRDRRRRRPISLTRLCRPARRPRSVAPKPPGILGSAVKIG